MLEIVSNLPVSAIAVGSAILVGVATYIGCLIWEAFGRLRKVSFGKTELQFKPRQTRF